MEAADGLSPAASRHVSLGHSTKVKTREVTSEFGPVLRTRARRMSADACLQLPHEETDKQGAGGDARPARYIVIMTFGEG